MRDMTSFRRCSLSNLNGVIFLFGCLLTVGAATFADGVDEWIAALGADSYAQREAASLGLWEMGSPALSEVRQAAQSKDPEVRMRAKKLLPMLEAGVRPRFSASLTQEVLTASGLSNSNRDDLAKRILNKHGKETFHFLSVHLSGNHRNWALKHFEDMLDAFSIEEDLIPLLQYSPPDKREGRLLLKALMKSGTADHLEMALRLEDLSNKVEEEITQKALDLTLASFNAKDFKQTMALANRFWSFKPNETRFLYLLAFAVHSSQSPDAATPYLLKIKALNPDDEIAHYRAGTFLQNFSEASKPYVSWELGQVLKILPEDSLYDMKSLLELAKLNERRGSYLRAADAYEKSLHIFRSQKASGLAVTLSGGDEEDLEAEILKLRNQASKTIFGNNPIHTHYLAVVKREREEAYFAAVNRASGQMNFELKPWVDGVIEEGIFSLKYDADTEKIIVTFKGEVIDKEVDFTFREGEIHRLLLNRRFL
jgi:hypothetical protein